MSSPRVWSRDDFLDAARLCRVEDWRSSGDSYRTWMLKQCESICGILEFAERNATLHVDQGRDERGRFLPKPQLHLDSPIVIEARAG